ncbi:MAG TPA: hypothetical protein VLS94_08040 [Fusibacter sp.]|nr:hypothetical protein [Fusibacter sp.]
MKKRWVWITAIVLLFAFPLTACGTNIGESGNADDPLTNTDENAIDNADTDTIEANEVVVETEQVPLAGADSSLVSGGKIDNLTDYSDAWSDLYSIHEPIINDYTGMPIMPLVMVGLPLANAIFYTMLDLDNVDGEFSGNIGFGGTEGYYNKSGDVAEFGHDLIRDVDGIVSNDKAGDRNIITGLFDASKGYFYMEDSTQRDDKTFTRTKTEFIRSDNGSFLCLYQVANDLDYGGNENKTNTLAFIAMSEDSYEFVTAEGTIGIDGMVLALTKGMTVAEATMQFIDAGYAIDQTGGIQNGVFVVD